MASIGTNYQELNTQIANEFVGGPVSRNQHGGFMILTESNFSMLPPGRVCVHQIGQLREPSSR
jgi:hypothetical protein